jgi:hypothetical protein
MNNLLFLIVALAVFVFAALEAPRNTPLGHFSNSVYEYLTGTEWKQIL